MANRTCSIEGCETRTVARGWCQTHYQRWRTKGTTDDPEPRVRPVCTIDGCDRPNYAHGCCGAHYAQSRRRGSPTPEPLRYPTVESRMEALGVSDATGCLLYTGPLNRNGYGVINVPVRPGARSVHRVAWERANGPIPEGLQIDHICRVRNCFNVEHLRLVTPAQNSQNRSQRPHWPTNTSGMRGVTLDPRTETWVVRIFRAGELVHRARFADLDDAKADAVAARNRLHTHNDTDRLPTCPDPRAR